MTTHSKTVVGGLYVWWSAATEAARLRIAGARRLSRREADWLLPILSEAGDRLGLPRLLIDDRRDPTHRGQRRAAGAARLRPRADRRCAGAAGHGQVPAEPAVPVGCGVADGFAIQLAAALADVPEEHRQVGDGEVFGRRAARFSAVPARRQAPV